LRSCVDGGKGKTAEIIVGIKVLVACKGS